MFRHGDLRFAFDAVAAFSYLAHHCHVPVIKGITVTNEGNRPLDPRTLIVDIPGYALPLALTIEPPPPGETLRIAPIALTLLYDRLQGLEARRYAALTVTVDEREIFRDEILVLGFYEWSFAPEARKTLACYVQPGQAVVQQIIAHADGLAVGSDGEPGHMPPGDAGWDVEREVRGLYDTLRLSYNLRYVLEAPSYEIEGQAIRPPHRVITNPRARAGAGTCIDLSLLFASCLESLRLQPLVIVTRDRQQAGRHAVVGCWTRVSERLEPVIESRSRLNDAVRHRRLIPLEATGVTLSAGRTLSFEEAVEAAGQRLIDGELVFALDVAAARATVAPLEFPLSPGALSILGAGHTIARCEGSATMETKHLLRAVIGHGGHRVAAFFAGEGLRGADTPDGRAMPCGDSAPLRATLNYRRCIDDARAIAADCGAGFVEEEHLVYAVLLSPSRSVARELAGFGLDRERLLHAYRAHFLWTKDLVSTEQGGAQEGPSQSHPRRVTQEGGHRGRAT
jgi:hypothetical protein